MADQVFVKRHGNLEFLKSLNQVYEDAPKTEQEVTQMRSRHYELVKDQWYIAPHSIEEFDELIAKARQNGKKAGMKKTDVAEAVFTARVKKIRSSSVQNDRVDAMT